MKVRCALSDSFLRPASQYRATFGGTRAPAEVAWGDIWFQKWEAVMRMCCQRGPDMGGRCAFTPYDAILKLFDPKLCDSVRFGMFGRDLI